MNQYGVVQVPAGHKAGDRVKMPGICLENDGTGVPYIREKDLRADYESSSWFGTNSMGKGIWTAEVIERGFDYRLVGHIKGE